MRVTITGSRDYSNPDSDVILTLDLYKPLISEINVGDARGVDAVAWQWAKDNDIPWTRYEADWDKHGRRAGHIRNQEMLRDGSRGCLAIWNGIIGGTSGCFNRAAAMDSIIWVCICKVLRPLDKEVVYESSNRLHSSRTVPAIQVPRTKRWSGAVRNSSNHQ